MCVLNNKWLFKLNFKLNGLRKSCLLVIMHNNWYRWLTRSRVLWIPFSFAWSCCSLFDEVRLLLLLLLLLTAVTDVFAVRLVLPLDTDGRLLAAVEDFWLSFPARMLDLLPVLEGATETSVTSSDRFVPGRVESGSARPLTGKSSMLQI